MTRVLPRTSFHSSKLVRCLADLAIVDTADPGNAFAEKLGQWIHFADAIALSAVHNDGRATPPGLRPDAQAAARAGTEFDRIRALLAESIAKSCSPNPGKSHIKLPEPRLELPMDFAAAYAPYRRFYEAHQRDMELSIQPLRTNVRAELAKASPRLGKLAELDATLEKILRDRESKLLAKVPVLLKKRFEQLFTAHQQRLADTRQDDNPAGWTHAGGWLERFRADMQMLLLAELELRLQPAMGLVEAFKQETQ
ncbi:DUF3348 domain-containing protein [Noviherbaspirillum sp. UKPF54]|uniref:DUF3348 domain-containing protein n=1 Tax=Noviherbaspirillum sp. UKPF54 TaxID=2601898 RepID=UPI0011B171F4|nr:DUF3348 domain-containing protein [Noviherbaspirillum sp. UKPF54]QDZ27123.1 DUF3348 domain-containing protein [Noviherbaspirillum sp. UKPF54]